MERAFEQTLAEQCAPTLAGCKPASLFRWRGGGVSELERSWGPRFAPYGIGLRVLKTCPDTGDGLIYLYRARWLRRILTGPEVSAFLQERGYQPEKGCGGLLRELSGRLGRGEAFPHEIGIFLGYPLEDVAGFIQNSGQNCTCCGCWKCYGDPEAARRRFALYRQCTESCREKARQGIPVTEMIGSA